jgi:hypothetical protein
MRGLDPRIPLSEHGVFLSEIAGTSPALTKESVSIYLVCRSAHISVPPNTRNANTIPQRMKIEATSNGIVPLLASTSVGMLVAPMNAALIPVNYSGDR